ncbi:MAG: hypothetical protein NTV54_00285 [Ignavibacteriales bacterium]|nr:hypothetical protein [Ignavibacteriales bacterium]
MTSNNLPDNKSVTGDSRTSSKPESRLFLALWLIIIAISSALYFSNVATPGVPLAGGVWMIPAGKIILQGVDLFQGQIPDVGWTRQETGTMIWLIISYIICPGMFLFGWRGISLLPSKDKLPWMASAEFVVGGALTLCYLIPSPYFATKQVHVSTSMRETQAAYSLSDMIANDLSEMGFQIRERYILSNVGREGPRRWGVVTETGGRERPLTLADLPASSSRASRMFHLQYFPNISYGTTMDHASHDTVSTIVAIGNQPGENHDFVNNNNARGLIQRKMVVTPHTMELEYSKEN